MSAATTPLIACERVDTHYGRSHILRGVDFHVMPGEVVSLLGRNGMGKTTLLRTLVGLVRPSAGRVRLRGADVAGARPSAIARQGVALVPEGRDIFPNLSVEENLTMAARARRGATTGWDLARIYRMFPRLAERRGNWGDRLSGGEQKMLAIGRALMTDPDVLLLDEATEGLAPQVREAIWTTLAAIRDAGIAVVVVDKNLPDLMALAHRHVILVKGEVVFDGDTAALAADPDLLHRHLGV